MLHIAGWRQRRSLRRRRWFQYTIMTIVAVYLHTNFHGVLSKETQYFDIA